MHPLGREQRELKLQFGGTLDGQHYESVGFSFDCATDKCPCNSNKYHTKNPKTGGFSYRIYGE